MPNLSDSVGLIKVQDHTTANTTTVTSDAIDMLGYEGVLILTSFGTAAANNTVKVQQSSDDGSTDAYSDLEGTSVVSGTSDEDVWVDVVKPTKRYLKLVAARGTSSTLESIWAIRYGARKQPVDNTTSGTIIGEAHVSPAEGTA
jgi:hypothetical protein